MNATKPIKRHPALVELSKDHHFGLLLSWKIRQGEDLAIDTSRIGKYVEHVFVNELEYHFKEEEELLFDRMPADDELRKQAESEHKNLRSLRNQIRENASIDTLKKFSELLEQHIRFEERTLFNHIQNSFSDDLLTEIGNELKQRKHPEQSMWTDSFWIKKN